ncbi:hypothetical protein [uncultured Microbacterium sp.]|uniref:hypothetical protein n=1 Tax=uncultured Microbacterium sp. TaxID=191216 RepID=UPI0035CB40C4
MTIALERPLISAAPVLSSTTPARLTPVTDYLCRVIDSRGIVIGHVQAVPLGDGMRFRARRYHSPSRGFRDLGDFWSADDAVDCLRFAR